PPRSPPRPPPRPAPPPPRRPGPAPAGSSPPPRPLPPRSPLPPAETPTWCQARIRRRIRAWHQSGGVRGWGETRRGAEKAYSLGSCPRKDLAVKKDIHPDYHPVLFVDHAANYEFTSRSTLKSNEKKVIDGVEYY